MVFCGRFLVILLLLGCGESQDLSEKPLYEGPIMELDSVNTLISDSAKVMLRKQAPHEEQFESGDVIWSEGLFLRYYDKDGSLSSTFKSDFAEYIKETDLYKGTGNVVVQNVTNGDELKTEELFWDPSEHQFYTERFVTITSDGELHTGEGLTANEDFTSYTILKPAGTITMNESESTDEAN